MASTPFRASQEGGGAAERHAARKWRSGRPHSTLHCGEGDMSFTDRSDAGRQLAQALLTYKDQQPVILALLRGGVPVAAEVAAALDAPLDLILVRKIGVPMQPELAMGAVANGGGPIVVCNDDVIRMAGVDEAEFQAVRDREPAEIERPRKLSLRNPAPLYVAGRRSPLRPPPRRPR